MVNIANNKSVRAKSRLTKTRRKCFGSFFSFLFFFVISFFFFCSNKFGGSRRTTRGFPFRSLQLPLMRFYVLLFKLTVASRACERAGGKESEKKKRKRNKNEWKNNIIIVMSPLRCFVFFPFHLIRS